jgi:hypothetical protein
MKIVGASTSGGAAHTKQPSLLMLKKKTHVFEIAWILARKGAKRPIFDGNMPPKKMSPNIGADIGAITGILLSIWAIAHLRGNETRAFSECRNEPELALQLIQLYCWYCCRYNMLIITSIKVMDNSQCTILLSTHTLVMNLGKWIKYNNIDLSIMRNITILSLLFIITIIICYHPPHHHQWSFLPGTFSSSNNSNFRELWSL